MTIERSQLLETSPADLSFVEFCAFGFLKFVLFEGA